MAEPAAISEYHSQYGSIESFRRQAIANCLPSQPLRHAGVLIEGVDYSGKTTVCDVIEQKLTEWGIFVVRNACFLQDHPIIEALLALAKASNEMGERDVLYTASLLLDLSLTRSLPSGYYRIQERHVLTQIGRNSYFYDNPESWHIDTMRQLRPQFSCQIYLTSNQEAKVARTLMRRAKSPRDAVLVADPGLHQHYDDAMRASLPPGEGWHVIDTSDLTVEETADAVLAEIWRRDAELLGQNSALQPHRSRGVTTAESNSSKRGYGLP